MSDTYEIRPVARIKTDFGEKFGIPRQSGLVPSLRGRIVFEPEFRNPDAVRELDGFSHIWLIFGFSEVRKNTPAGEKDWMPMVKPPRLGGKRKVGVFASRSPYRPNSLGLSVVRLISVSIDEEEGPVLEVGGADLLDGTPIYDIKPYLPYGDSIADASSGYSVSKDKFVSVEIPDDIAQLIPADKLETLKDVLALDPRGAYEKQPDYVYGMNFAGFDIRFRIEDDTAKVFEAVRTEDSPKHIK
ncbi:MAG: tRNA (N6-threonylcarbamoyladenosine(37)-N6)-methyltransferase TrmO [Lachnospiraceae bacterium]|nr:tRNA (N6-threonylcarbamoyladenosine(37)-N6)-methyltransferase TrmO [Lachnospiraceae bacterium]